MVSRPVGGRTIMMGTKIRSFTPLPRDISLEELVPKDHFYRRLEARLDLSFVRELVGPLYADGGRPSVDPVVFFKLQTGDVFRGPEERAPTHAGRLRPLVLELVPGLRPPRAAARPLLAYPDQGTIRPCGLPPVLRADRAGVLCGWPGMGQGVVLRRHQGRGGRCRRLAG